MREKLAGKRGMGKESIRMTDREVTFIPNIKKQDLTPISHSRLLRRGLGAALAVIVLLVASQAYALTNVNGTITTDTTWDIVGSPYVLTGRLL